MPENTAPGRAKRMFLLIMLVMGTLLHGYSVAHIYIPAVVRVLSVMRVVTR